MGLVEMSEPQLVSSDPNWQPVSTDPNWQGDAATTDPHAPRMSAARPGSARPPVPQFETANDAAFFRAAGLKSTAGIDVTIGELRERPIESMQKIGAALKADASDPTVWLNLAAAYFGPKIFNFAKPIVARAVKSASQSAGKVAGAAVDAVDADLVSIVSPRSGALLKKAQQVKEAFKARATVAEVGAPTVEATVPSQKTLTPLELTRSMKPTGEALERAKAEAFATQPAAAAPAASAAPPPPSAPSTSPSLTSLMQSGMKPTEAARALKLLRQGVDPAEVQARILAARPSAPSVAPAELSPIQRSINMKPGVEPSTAQVANGLALAARRAKVTLTAADEALLTPLVAKGVAPETALQQLPALKLLQLPGTMTDAEMAAEIAARKGNRSPKRE